MIIRSNYILIFLLPLLSTLSFAQSDNGVIRIKSPHGVEATINKLEKVLQSKGMTIFNRVPHSEAANKVGLELRETELLIFGNPKIGSLLMQCQQSAAIDLPMKAIAYKDENGQVWLAYNEPKYIADRHQARGCNHVVDKMTKAMSNFSRAATQ